MKTKILSIVAVSLVTSAKAQTDLSVAMFPYVPEGSSGIERFESAFEEYAASQGVEIDLDLELVPTYKKPVDALNYDIAEIDLAVIDPISDKLADLSKFGLQGLPTQAIGVAAKVSDWPWATKVLPHWICGNFLIHWESDDELKAAESFNQILAALNPSEGRYLFADLWGGGTLGEFYADAVLDLRGHEFAKEHLKQIAGVPDDEIKSMLQADAILAIWRLGGELHPQHDAEREKLHDLTYVYPRAFADEEDSALIGYSERTYHLERDHQDEPWDGDKWPVNPALLQVRQFPFAAGSKGTPSWCDSFVVPKERLEGKEEAVKLFLQFAMSEEGYQMLLEPREYYPGAYLLPAYQETLDSPFVSEKMPFLKEFAEAADDSFPIFDHKVYLGLDRAGDVIEALLGDAR